MKHLSDEHRRKIGEANRRRKLSDKTKKKMSLSHKGIALGRKHSQVTIDKMKEKRKLQVFSKETKDKISKAHKVLKRTGSKNPNWKGGMTPIHLKIRTSNRYDQWRQQIFLRDNFTCQKCGDDKGGNLQAHHKKPFSRLLKEVRQYLPLFDLYEGAMIYAPLWNIDNGITLCDKCHRGISTNKRNLITGKFEEVL